jgi:hypothetical protein
MSLLDKLLSEPVDKSDWVQVHFCYVFMDGEAEKKVKTYQKKSIAQREITKWMKKARWNFCEAYHYDTDKWYSHRQT